MSIPYQDLLAFLEAAADPSKAPGMAAYMRDQFPFLGLNKPERQKLCRAFFKAAKKDGEVDWAFVDECWQRAEREFQYVACDYLAALKEHLVPDDLERIKHLATTKPWWDTVDNLDVTAGSITRAYPQTKPVMLAWSCDNASPQSLWLRRIAIDHQLMAKDATDTALLAQIIENNLAPAAGAFASEFFINKAIGWALRDYSKTNPTWVRAFIDTHREHMAKLSIREGSKYV
jgi:3-methyladenine DNA glycosylase AlkD